VVYPYDGFVVAAVYTQDASPLQGDCESGAISYDELALDLQRDDVIEAS
jgi:hypothetical protein